MPGRSHIALLLASALAGCNAAPRQVPYARPYPLQLARAETLTIQVIRQGPQITLTNTTARDFGPSTIWLNSRFSYPIDGLAVGETITLDLGRFADENSDRFRPGGFFATEDPDLLVLAELETISEFTGEPQLLGLIAVGNRRGE